MKETFANVCLVKDIRPPVFSALLTYIYTDTLQLQRPEDITELLVVANQVTSRFTRKRIRFRSDSACVIYDKNRCTLVCERDDGKLQCSWPASSEIHQSSVCTF